MSLDKELSDFVNGLESIDSLKRRRINVDEMVDIVKRKALEMSNGRGMRKALEDSKEISDALTDTLGGLITEETAPQAMMSGVAGFVYKVMCGLSHEPELIRDDLINAFHEVVNKALMQAVLDSNKKKGMK